MHQDLTWEMFKHMVELRMAVGGYEGVFVRDRDSWTTLDEVVNFNASYLVEHEPHDWDAVETDFRGQTEPSKALYAKEQASCKN